MSVYRDVNHYIRVKNHPYTVYEFLKALKMHCHGGFKVKRNRFKLFSLSNVHLCNCIMYYCILYMPRWFQVFLEVVVCVQSVSSTVLCLFVFCFLFITLSALAEHLGIEFMGMNRSFLLVCRSVGLEAWACFLQLQLVSFCSWRDQTAITDDWHHYSFITVYINALLQTSDGCLEPLCRFLGF